MSFEYFIGARYLKAKQKQAFISMITVLSVAGVTVGVMALIVVIAVMSGFEDDLKSRILGVESHLVLMRHGGPFEGYSSVMEKMGSLGRVGMDLGVHRFHDGAHSADVRPADRNAQPAVGRAPSPGADQDIFAVPLDKRCVDAGDLAGHSDGPGGIEGFRIDENQVGHAGVGHVAQRVLGDADGPGSVGSGDLHGQHLFPGAHGSNL